VALDRYEVYAEIGGTPVQVAEAPASATSARSAVDLPDDATHRWFVRLVNVNGGTASTPPEQRTAVTVATPPGAPALTELPAGAPAARAFAWAGDRVGSRWAVLDHTGQAVRSGEAPSASGRADLEGLDAGAYVFRVVQLNAAGIEGAAAARSFVVDVAVPATPVPAPVAAAPSRGDRALAGSRPRAAAAWRRSAHRLRPAAGAVVRTGRPAMRWTPGPRGTTAYNLQVFEITGERMRKVRSAYPSGTAFALPRRAALRPGRCYVWRVWPYRGRAYTSAPLAVSDFCVRPAGGTAR
jgi:hypothetical protein